MQFLSLLGIEDFDDKAVPESKVAITDGPGDFFLNFLGFHETAHHLVEVGERDSDSDVQYYLGPNLDEEEDDPQPYWIWKGRLALALFRYLGVAMIETLLT